MFGFKNGKGAIVVDGRHVADTMQCVHCGMHWECKPGSKRKRGFCVACRGATCGKERCDIHLPYEAYLELEEGKRDKVLTRYLKAYRQVKEFEKPFVINDKII